jgi:glycosyltransferase involved in cell wall biosynthesis
MRIAVYHNLPPGGAKRAVYEQVKYFSKKNEIHLFKLSSTDDSFLPLEKYVSSTKDYEFDLNSKLPGFLNRLDKDFRNFVMLDRMHKEIAEDIDKKGFDYVLVHPSQLTQAPFLLKHLKTPSIYFCEEYLRIAYEKYLQILDGVSYYKKGYEKLTRKLRKAIDRNNAKAANIVVANSRFTKNNIDMAYQTDARYAQLGVDVNIFKKTTKSRKNHLLYIGDKNKVGGYDIIEKAVDKLDKKIMINSLGYIKGKLKINNDLKLAKEYSGALATVCTQFNEPFGLAPIESMACETPVLAVNEGGYKETVVDGKTGFLLPRDPVAFAKKIKWLIKYPEKAKEMGKAGRKHVKKNFTWEIHNMKMEKIINETIIN